MWYALSRVRAIMQYNNNIMRVIVCVVLPARFFEKGKTIILFFHIAIFFPDRRILFALFGRHVVYNRYVWLTL